MPTRADSKQDPSPQLLRLRSPSTALKRLKVNPANLRSGITFVVGAPGDYVMRKIALLLLLIGIALPAYARQVTLAELEQCWPQPKGSPTAKWRECYRTWNSPSA